MSNLYSPHKMSYTVLESIAHPDRYREIIVGLGLTLASSISTATVMIIDETTSHMMAEATARRHDIPCVVYTSWLLNAQLVGRVFSFRGYELKVADEDAEDGVGAGEDEGPVAGRASGSGELPEDSNDEDEGDDEEEEEEEDAIVPLQQYDMPLPPPNVRLVKLGRGFSIRHTAPARAYTEVWTRWFYTHVPTVTLCELSRTYVRVLNKAFHVNPGMSPASMKWYLEGLWSSSEAYRRKVNRLTRVAGNAALRRSAYEQVDHFLAAAGP